jgi:transposase-like protein
MNLVDVSAEFTTDEQCLEFLEKQRWPDGVVRCPTCGSSEIARITRKSMTKNKRKRIYQCQEKTCKQQFSATNGTIFHGSHIPLQKWFLAIAMIADAKKGVSAKQIQRRLGIGSYKTAWYMCHRIRKGMADLAPTPMTGIIEVDETFLGGRAVRRHRKTPRPPKEMVLAIRERNTKLKPGRVRFFHVPDGKRVTLQPIMEKHIGAAPIRIYTDDAAVYDFSLNKEHRRRHRKVNHSKEWVVPGSKIHTNSVESAFSLLKRGLVGNFHHVSVKHLHRYLSEFEFRFNARRHSDCFASTLSRMLATPHMAYRTLTSSVSGK